MRSKVPALQRNIGIGGAATFFALLVIGFPIHMHMGVDRTVASFLIDPTALMYMTLIALFAATALLNRPTGRVIQVSVLLVFGYVSLALGARGSLTGFAISGVGVILAAHYGYFRQHTLVRSVIVMSGIIVGLLIQVIRVAHDTSVRWATIEFVYGATAVAGLLFAYFIVIRDAAASAERRQALLEQAVQLRTADLSLEMNARRTAENLARQSAESAQYLAEQRMALLQEVHHRAKNSLQMALVLLESCDPDSPGALALTVNRVRAIGLVYDLADASGNFSAISLEDYLRELLGYLQMSSSNLQIMYEPDGIHKTALDPTVNFGLAIHEIIQLAQRRSLQNEPGTIVIEQHSKTTALEFIIRYGGQLLPAGFSVHDDANEDLGLLPAFFERLRIAAHISVTTENQWSIVVPFAAIMHDRAD